VLLLVVRQRELEDRLLRGCGSSSSGSSRRHVVVIFFVLSLKRQAVTHQQKERLEQVAAIEGDTRTY